MSLIVRTNPWQEELWNVSLLPAATLLPAGKPVRNPEPRADALRAPAILSSSESLGEAAERQAA